MKKKSSSKSAFFNPRALIGFGLCLIGLLLALLAYTAYPGASALAQSGPASPMSATANSPSRPDVVRMVGPVRLDKDLRYLPWVAPKAEHEEQLQKRKAAYEALETDLRILREVELPLAMTELSREALRYQNKISDLARLELAARWERGAVLPVNSSFACERV